jgi:hypothetical protein
VHVIDDVLPPAAIDTAYATFESSQIPMSTLFVGPSDPAARLCDVMPVPFALLLARYLDQIHSEAIALGYQPAATFELWTNVSRPTGPNVFLHVDNDEELRASTGEVVTPEFGTILYLGPDGDVGGGETLICYDEPSDELCADVLFRSLPAERVKAAVGSNTTAVAPQRGRACIFRGSLPHCVLPVAELVEGPRITFLANGWAIPPTGAASGS